MTEVADTLVRYIGRIKERICKKQNGETFMKSTLFINNVDANNKDGTPNEYHEGVLLWLDQKTGQKFIVKQVELAGVSQAQRDKGFVNSIKLNLSDTYHVQNLG